MGAAALFSHAERHLLTRDDRIVQSFETELHRNLRLQQLTCILALGFDAVPGDAYLRSVLR